MSGVTPPCVATRTPLGNWSSAGHFAPVSSRTLSGEAPPTRANSPLLTSLCVCVCVVILVLNV